MTIKEKTYKEFMERFDRDEDIVSPSVVCMKMMVSSLLIKDGFKTAIEILTLLFGAYNIVVYNQDFKPITSYIKHPVGLTKSIKARIKKQDNNDFILEYNAVIDKKSHNIITYSVHTERNIYYVVVVDNDIIDEQLKSDALASSKIAFFTIFEHFELVKQLKSYSHVDALTGVKSRFVYQKVSRNLKKFSPEVTFVVCDLFSLKKINDDYGHPAGDTYLKNAAKCMEELFPKCVYKIGGDEFIIILPGKVDVDKKMEIVNKELTKVMKRSIKKTNELYHINYGYHYGKTSEVTAKSFYQTADRDLSEDKKDFYSQHNVERRNR